MKGNVTQCLTNLIYACMLVVFVYEKTCKIYNGTTPVICMCSLKELIRFNRNNQQKKKKNLKREGK